VVATATVAVVDGSYNCCSGGVMATATVTAVGGWNMLRLQR